MQHGLDQAAWIAHLDRQLDVLRLAPQHVGRFYTDGNRMGQRRPDARRPAYFRPERWIGSSTAAVNPPRIPSGGVSRVIGGPRGGVAPALRDLLAHDALGPRLLGEARHAAHREFRVLTKILDAHEPIPFHVHADDAYVAAHPRVYPGQRLGKDEAYYFLDAPKGACPHTHVGLHAGVGPRQVIAAMRRGADHVLELSPAAYQRLGEGMIVRAGLFHRPGTALTLEVQQPSDVYAFFQREFCGRINPPSLLHPGFKSIEAAAEAVVNWEANRGRGLIERATLTPTAVTFERDGSIRRTRASRAGGAAARGGRADWIYPPWASRKFSGIRLTVEGSMTMRCDEPMLLFVWSGRGRVNAHPCAGGRGALGFADEFFVGHRAAAGGLSIHCTGEEPLIVFAIFAAEV